MSGWRADRSAARVLLVRHGRTAVNAQGRLSGRHDPDLDEVGRLQVAALATAVVPMCEGPTLVVSSPLGRCRQTAEAIVAAFDDPAPQISLDDRFVEMDYGEWDGLPLAEIPESSWERWRSDPEFTPPGGESLAAVTRRVSDGIAHWAPLATGGTLVVVSHVSPIKAAVIWALGVGEAATWRMRLDNASICRLAVSSGGPDATCRGSLGSFNESAHLEALEG